MPLTIEVFIPAGETTATLSPISGTGTAANQYTITQLGSSQFGTITVADAANLLGEWQWKVGTRAIGKVVIVAGQTSYPIQTQQAAAAAAITAAGLATSGDVDSAEAAILDAIDAIEGGGAGSSGGTNGTGTYRITVTLASSVGGTLLHGARVSIAGTATHDYTNQSGIAVLNVNNGTYAVSIIAPPGFVNPDDLSVTVTGANESRTVSVTPKQITAPEGANECRVAVDVIDQFGSPYNGVTVSAIVDSSVTGAEGAGILNKYAKGKKTVDGRAELDLIQGVTYTITFEKDHQAKSFSYEVPIASTAIATETF